MKIYNLYSIALAVLLSATVAAQTKTASQPKKSTQPTTASQTKTTSQKPLTDKSDSLKMAVQDLKTSFNTLFGGKRDTIAIMIANIDYDDANLSLLKENLKKLKGVKAVNMQYKSATAIMQVSFKGKSTDLWDKLPQEAKEPFKLLEADDNNIKLQHKSAKTGQ